MKNSMKKLFSIITLLVVTLLAALLAPASAFADYDYVIKSYDINMIVNEDNNFNITENISAYFNIPKHGILRKIPLENEIVRLDGTKSRNRAKISDINADDQYSAYKENNNMIIRIGDPDITITGAKDYSISYTYNIGKDTGKGYDELYFNLIGHAWDTTISNISFTITMPKSFDKSKLGFSSGVKSSTESKNVNYTVNDNVIKGKYIGTLNPEEGLTVRLELPDGYFVEANYNFDFKMKIALFLPVIFLVMFFLLWMAYGRDNKVIVIPGFYPPQGFNSAEVGFLYKGSADDKDVVSLLIYLANKGYIRISETTEKPLPSKKKDFKITKIKDYDGDDINERIFIDGLFKKKADPTITKLTDLFKKSVLQEIKDTGADSLNEVTASDLYNSFYITMGEIKGNLNSRENKEKIFEKSSLGKGIWGFLAIIIIFLLITVRPVLEYDASNFLLALLFPAIGFSVMFGFLIWGAQTVQGMAKLYVTIFIIIWGSGFGGVPWAMFVLPALSAEPIYLMTYLVGIACIVGIMILLKLMPKRTKYGNEMLGQIKGFKNFLKTTEKNRLETFVMTDSKYFYNTLPYSYVLGISDKWIKKFETIAMKAPDWYEGTGAFNTVAFGSIMTATMTTALSAMSSSPSSDSSSSSSSGGGSSGGGSGGGGGSSW